MAGNTRSQRVIRFIETYCVIPEGKHVGKPMVLAKFQKKFLRDIYDNPHAKTQRAYLSIARKNGKSGLIAAIVLVHLVGPEAKRNSQIVSGAMSRDQAALVFSLAAKMVTLSPMLSEIVRIIPSGKRLHGLPLNVEYKALAAEGKTAHGLSPVLAILDEVGQITGPQSDFVDAITTSQGAYENPLLIAISTQAPNDADLFSVWVDDALAEAKKPDGDRSIVCHLYAADQDAAIMDKKAWHAANPALGIFLSEDYVRKQAEKAARMPSAENTFRNLILNQRVSRFSPFVSRDVWLSNGAAPLPLADASRVYIGLDLSARLDLTAAIILAEHGKEYSVHTLMWTPAEGVVDRAKRDRAPYDLWVRQGHLLTTPGKTVNYSHVLRDLMEYLGAARPGAVAFDRWRIAEFKKAMEELGITEEMLPLVEFGQGFRDMSPAVDTTEELLLGTRLRHGNHPVLTACAANATVLKDAAGNRKLDKSKSTGRIDGMVSLTMAIGAMGKPVETEAPKKFQLYAF